MGENLVDKSINDKIVEFQALLDGISKLADKKKALWMDVYRNALQDRDNAIKMYSSVSGQVVSQPTDHALLGPVIAKYLERASRANDQLLKLAELVAAAEEKAAEEEAMSLDDIYDRMSVDPKQRKKA